MDVLLKSKNLKNSLLEGFQKKIKEGQMEGVLRIEIPISRRNILTWLSKQNSSTKVYWCARDNSYEIAGVGIADMMTGTKTTDHQAVLNDIQKNLSPENRNLCYLGGFCFDPDNLDSEWKAFGTYRFWLPRFEIININGEYSFACNLLAQHVNDDALRAIESEFDQLDFSNEKDPDLHLLPKSRQDFPAYPVWAKLVGEVIRSFEKGYLEKVVLARKTIFHFAKPLAPIEVMGQVKKNTPNCFHFCFQINEHAAFLGASPERLYLRDGGMLATEAIAGTRTRGKNLSEDESRQKELLDSPKDKKEHQFVVETLRDNLLAICTEFKSSLGASILKLKDSQHLISRFEGTLKKGTSDCEILSTLHPTPAVAGCPTQEAVKTIERLEPFKRGWYAAPVGWIGPQGAEFAVAIRSGMIQNDQLALYSGAGLVKGSLPEAEWDEIENKMSSFMKVFKA